MYSIREVCTKGIYLSGTVGDSFGHGRGQFTQDTVAFDLIVLLS